MNLEKLIATIYEIDENQPGLTSMVGLVKQAKLTTPERWYHGTHLEQWDEARWAMLWADVWTAASEVLKEKVK